MSDSRSVSRRLATWSRQQRIRAWRRRALKARGRGEAVLAEWCEREASALERGESPVLARTRL